MNRELSMLMVCFFGFCLVLSAQQRDEGVEVEVQGLEATPIGIAITLRATDKPEALHLMIGFPEGQSIARALQHQKADRPMSHDLFKAFLDRNGWRAQKVLIRDMKEGTFLADLTLEKDNETQVYDARPSDALAIGIRYGAKIYVNPQVFEKQKQGQGEEEQEEKTAPPEQLTL